MKRAEVIASAVFESRVIVRKLLRKYSMGDGEIAECIDRALYEFQHRYDGPPTAKKKPRPGRRRKRR